MFPRLPLLLWLQDGVTIHSDARTIKLKKRNMVDLQGNAEAVLGSCGNGWLCDSTTMPNRKMARKVILKHRVEKVSYSIILRFLPKVTIETAFSPLTWGVLLGKIPLKPLVLNITLPRNAYNRRITIDERLKIYISRNMTGNVLRVRDV